MAFAEWGAAVLGASISGIIGVFAVEYRNQRTEFTERRQWYDKLIRLCERVERSVVDKDKGATEESQPKDENGVIDHIELTHGVVSSQLHQHIGEAPPTVGSKILEQAEDVARLSKYASENTVPARDSMGYIGTYSESSAEKAETLKQMARDEKEDIGFLWL